LIKQRSISSRVSSFHSGVRNIYAWWFFILLLAISRNLSSQSPHGDNLKLDCSACHNTNGWEIPLSDWNFKEGEILTRSNSDSSNLKVDTLFNHYDTGFPLTGTHNQVDCRMCHASMIFEEASKNCVDCHLDVHSMTVGDDCKRCHVTNNWLVDNIPELHEENGFPLFGVHATSSCVDCHISETSLKFDRIGNDCISCHLDEYESTTNPNHKDAGFSTNCVDCHNPDNDDWNTDNILHNFFPLTEGHDIEDCKACHTTDNYGDASPECITCHTDDFENAMNPNHIQLGFNNDCAQCHTLSPGWMPANFREHDDLYFPIYSGEHKGEWDECLDCHTDPNDYSVFSCTICHKQGETDDDHNGVTGYVYNDNACLACHPTGEEDGSFDHNKTNFPLTGAHIGLECLECHADGFEGTSTNCIDCHTADFNGSVNPNHQSLGLSQNCVDCHTTDPGWEPASFDIHDDYYPLNGAHDLISNECASCHNGDYNNTPNTCIGCHIDDYNGVNEPDHIALNFSTNCLECHTEQSWIPANFDHDAQYFPIYSGSHEGEWNTCIDCHTDPSNYSIFTCVGCHLNPETDEDHEGVSGYIYEDNACLACHPTGDADMVFDHDATGFLLERGHGGLTCIDCHSNGYAGTSAFCADCHTSDFEGTQNPDHMSLGLSNDCATCHTLDPGWAPASFAVHDDYYLLEGAHIAISNDCAACHNGDYNNTPNTCIGCHQMDYDEAVNPDHKASNFSTNCVDCHTQDSWIPSNFDHDAQYFPIYSGSHEGEWSACVDCHTDPANYSIFTCVGCHLNPETDEDHEGVSGYIYEDNACLACHPTGDADMVFDHDATGFILEGGHGGLTCIDCHGNGYAGTSAFCADCHTSDFEGTQNPDHMSLGLSNDCATCHTLDPGWAPASFAVHDDYYLLEGAHIAISNDCAACHNGDYSNTPNTCIGCHQMEYDNTTNPNHAQAQFGTSCLTCHNQDSWVPADFDHDAQYFPIYTGSHDGEWAACIDCHSNPNNYSDFQCINCHINPETDEDHEGIGGYLYENNACLACHPDGEAGMAFDHNSTNFPLTGAHIGVDCIDCHMNGYQNTSADCNDCHNEDYVTSVNPPHQALNIPVTCIDCHTTDPGWAPAGFDIHDNYFVLDGAHAAIANDCVECHNGDYINTPNTCAGCHQQDYDSSINPDHGQLNLSNDCVECHTTNPDWMPATFDVHDDYYPLNGAHASIANDCVECHNGDYINTPNTCIGCHQTEYDNASSPNHVAAGFPEDCTLCHSEDTWVPSTLDHDGMYFPIYSGSHDGEWNACLDCHANPNNFAEFQCINCHINPETDNDHTGIGGYIYEDNACLACHPNGESNGAFDHNTTGFVLDGGHLGLDCIDCHSSGYVGTPTNCDACHLVDHQNTSNPDHTSLNIPVTCDDCHTTDPGWSPATFDIHDNYYELTGAHVTIADQCVDCHNGAYINTPNTCVGCHQSDYDGSINPDHSSLNLSTDCVDCHTTNPDWMPATFEIHDNFYPLNGAHQTIANDCALCHNGNYISTPNTCIGCHQADFDGTTNPNHQANNFSTNCLDCHNEVAWMPSTFDHNQFWPLNGAHAAIENDCILCHSNGFPNTPNTCIGCHQSDYDGTTNPDHAAAGFPTDCTSCHTETAWTPANWDHDGMYFPIFSGKHDGEWNDCAECHTTPNDYTLFSCIDCHEHDDPAELASDHSGVSGYVYESNACYACHPDGSD
jgi:hypothetical protein